MPSPTTLTNEVLVRKYGGSSLNSVARIRAVAKDICAQRTSGKRVVVVVSAMGQTTNDLQLLAREITPRPPRREMDMLLSVGERITMSLLSMALAAEGCSAISYTGSQCGIITDNSHTNARITEVKADRVRESLVAGHVVVVAGFQGMSLPEKEITTLGRGGSDATAVALAAALGASRCEILKDVDGIMTADPKRLPVAKRLAALSYDELRDLAESGCGVVHLRAVEYAASHQVPLFVGSSFHDSPGTLVQAKLTAAEAMTSSARYRPLSLLAHEDMSWLGITVSQSETVPSFQELRSSYLGDVTFLSEWVEHGDTYRWGGLASTADLTSFHDRCRNWVSCHPADLTWLEGWTCLTLAGGRPDSWLTAEHELQQILSAEGVSSWHYRVDGPAIRVLVPARSLDSVHAAFHAALF